jgi:diguanylate cyclase (GGDEF)-like protein
MAHSAGIDEEAVPLPPDAAVAQGADSRPAESGVVARDASVPEVLDQRARDRDAAAVARDAAAELRDARTVGVGGEEAELSRALAARDRVAGALDRQEGALDRLRAAEYLQKAYRDTLTGAVHRDPGREELNREVDRAHRSGRSLIIAFLDVVALKRVNDEQGHAAGDDVLRAVGRALRSGLRSYDVIVRYGGDEFVCALPDSTLEIATQRLTDVSQALSLARPTSSVSVGLAELQADETLDAVIGRADRNLYDGRKAQPAR